MRALITGVAGFAGRALALDLTARGWAVTGSHGGRRPLPAALTQAGIDFAVHDLRDPARTAALVRDASPEVVFHLAGQTGVDLAAFMDSHVIATSNLLEAIRHQAPGAVVVIPGSSAQFGDVPADSQPITEDTPYRPGTLYGIAKVAEAWTAEHYHRQYGLRLIRTHTFNCMGPGQRSSFVPATFAAQIAAIERGQADPVLHVGNLASFRDMTDIRDVASAYFHVATKGRIGAVYNICSGAPVSIGSIVEGLCALARVRVEVRQDPARLQAIDVPTQRGDPTRLNQDTGWTPGVLLGRTLSDVLEEWRAAV